MRTLMVVVLVLAAVTGVASATGTIDFVLLLDESGSMETAPPFSDKTRIRVDSAKLFVELCGSADRVAVIGFGDRIVHHSGQVLQGLDPRWKSFLFQRLSGIGGSQAHTDMLAAIRSAITLLDARHDKADRTFILFLTDGKIDDARDIPPDYLKRWSTREYRGMVLRAAEECGRLGYPLLCIGLGASIDEGLLRELAALSGGRFYSARAASELEAIYTDIFVNQADRFSVRITQASSPIPVAIAHGLKEFIALAFPPSQTRGRNSFSAGFGFQPENGVKQGPTEVSQTKSWSLARLVNPAPGNWQVSFDPGQKVDVLLVKNTGCRVSVVKPSKPEYPPGPVDVEVLLIDEKGRPSDVGAGEVEFEIQGPGVPEETRAKLSKTGTGRFTARTQSLTQEGEYTLKVRTFAPGGREFVNHRSVSFKIHQVEASRLDVLIERPDNPAYLAHSRVPLVVRVTSSPPLTSATGQITLHPSLTGPPGFQPPRLTLLEEACGVFKGSTVELATPGTYSFDVTATLESDPRANGTASHGFMIVLPPPEALALTISRPLSRSHYPGVFEIKADLRGANGSPLPSGQATVSCDLLGPGTPRKVILNDQGRGTFAGQTPLLTQPGKYQAAFRAEKKDDARSFACRQVGFTIHPPVLVLDGIRLRGEHILFAGEPFDLEFKLKAGGIAGNPTIKAAVYPPVPPGEQQTAVDARPEPCGAGSYRIHHEGALLGATRVDLSASAPVAGGSHVTTSVAVPVEAFLAARVRDQSLPCDQPSTFEIDILSLHSQPVQVTAKVKSVSSAEEGSSAVAPALASNTSVALTRAETSDDFSAFPLTIDPSGAGAGPFKTDVDVTVSGKDPAGLAFSRTYTVKRARFQLFRPPMSSPLFWLVLLALAAAFFVRPHFGRCWLKVGEARIDIGGKTGLFGTEAGVGGPDQLVQIDEAECVPMVLRACWLGRFERQSTDGTFPLSSGDFFEVGGVMVRFIKGAEPKGPPRESPKEPPAESGVTPGAPSSEEGSVDDIA